MAVYPARSHSHWNTSLAKITGVFRLSRKFRMMFRIGRGTPSFQPQATGRRKYRSSVVLKSKIARFIGSSGSLASRYAASASGSSAGGGVAHPVASIETTKTAPNALETFRSSRLRKSFKRTPSSSFVFFLRLPLVHGLRSNAIPDNVVALHCADLDEQRASRVTEKAPNGSKISMLSNTRQMKPSSTTTRFGRRHEVCAQAYPIRQSLTHRNLINSLPNQHAMAV